MNSKYQKYYNVLNGKDFSTYVASYSSSLSEISTSFNSIESIMSSSTEKGLEYVKGTIIPSMKTQHATIEQGIQALSSAASKCNNLINKLNELKSASDYYSSCKEEEKESYRSKISSLESEIDTIINEINSISLDSQNENSSSGIVSTLDNTKTDGSIESLRAAFIGDVNDTSKYYIDPAYSKKLKELVCFDNTTGEILEEGDSFYMKPGETRVLTVRLPYNAGEIDQLLRTSADGDSTYRSGSVVTAKSDVNPDPNVVDYVNYKSWSNHFPDNVDLHTNYYDWIITAKADGTAVISQTCEYTNTDGDMPKAMIGINVVVKDDE